MSDHTGPASELNLQCITLQFIKLLNIVRVHFNHITHILKSMQNDGGEELFKHKLYDLPSTVKIATHSKIKTCSSERKCFVQTI